MTGGKIIAKTRTANNVIRIKQWGISDEREALPSPKERK